MSMFTEWDITARNLTEESASELRKAIRTITNDLNYFPLNGEIGMNFETLSHFAVDNGREILVDFHIAHPETELEALVKSECDEYPIKYRIHNNLLQTYTPTITYELASEERIGA